jgi:hypothetical protein
MYVIIVVCLCSIIFLNGGFLITSRNYSFFESTWIHHVIVFVWTVLLSSLWVVSFIMCLVCPVLMVSLDCPFLTTHSVFSNIYINRCLKKIILFLSKEGKSLESFLRRLQTLLKHYGRKISCCYRCLIDKMVLCDNLISSGHTVLNIKHYTINDFPWGEYKDWSTNGT